MTRFGDWLYRCLLRAFPARLRRAHGDDMQTLFAGLRRREAGRPIALVRLWACAIRDVLLQGLGARLAAARVSTSASDAGRPDGRRSVRTLADHLVHDLGGAARRLARRPGFAALAALILAIGIGANTAIFAVVNGVLLRPLPYADADRLVAINVAPGGSSRLPGSMSFPDLADLRELGPFGSLVGINGTNLTLTGRGAPAIIEVSRVTEGVLETLGAAPLIGRDIRPDEFGAGGPRVAVLAHGLWQERFGAAVDVVGESVTLNGVAYEVVGVAPPGVELPRGVSAWIPRRLDVADCGRGCHTMQVIGRLADGASLEAAAADVDRIAANLERQHPDTNTGKPFLVRALKTTLVGNVEAGIWITFASAWLVLLVTCANVASLLLAQASAREGEVAVRSALGASRGRLAAEVLFESGVLAAAGAAGGAALAFAGVAAFRRLAGTAIPRAELATIDATVLGVMLVSVVAVVALFAVLPALAVSRTPLSATLSRLGRGGAAVAASARFRRALVAGEVALSVGLLIAAGLLLRTFAALHGVEVGFDTREVVRFSVVLPESSYPEVERAVAFYESLEAELVALPGVEAAGAMFGPPLGRGRATGDVIVEGRAPAPPGQEPEASVRSVTPALLHTLRIPLVRGRLLSAADNRPGAEPVALVNEQFVRQHFPDEDPIGRRVSLTLDFGYGSPTWRIVGVVGDVRFQSLTEPAGADLYAPHGRFGPLSLAVHVRQAVGAPAIIESARRIVGRLDPNVPVYRTESLTQVLGAATAPTRLYLVVVALFAATAALLAAVGLYGVMSQMVVQRTTEIGLRMALGARRESIVALVVGQAIRPALAGLTVGVVAALSAARYLESVLYGVEPRDPVVFGVAAAAMSAVALAAAVVPAVRASGVDPSKVLQGG